jgi:hypothetical protein
MAEEEEEEGCISNEAGSLRVIDGGASLNDTDTEVRDGEGVAEVDSKSE